MTTQMIKYANRLGVKEPMVATYEDFETALLSKYNKKRKRGVSYYEFFDMTQQDFKFFFDFDKKVEDGEPDIDEEDFIENILHILTKLFNVDYEEIASSSDCRNKEDGSYKISFHCIIQRVTNIQQVKSLIPKIVKVFKNENIEVDTSVYSMGKQKMRTVFSKKDNEQNSLMVPLNHKEDLSKHLIQTIQGLPMLDLEHMNTVFSEVLNKEELIAVKMENGSSINDILKTFNIKSTKDENDLKYHIIEGGYECPFVKRVHTSNHCYLIESSNTLMLKCFDEECNMKCKMLFKDINEDTLEFDLKVFNSFDIKDTSEDNYVEKRNYFEKYYKYFTDSASFQRIKQNYNVNYDYYEEELVEVKKEGLGHLFYQRKDGEKIKNELFMKKYNVDNNRDMLFNVIFEPRTKCDSYYNMFNGFNYTKVLDEDEQIENEDLEDFNFFIDFIKVNVCENNDKFFDYFMSYFALILQNPAWLSHIILLLYSSKHGTGKSNFTKFFSKVIGEKYSYFGSYNQILGTHTTAHLGKFINVIEEVDMTKSKQVSEDMKNLSQRENAIYNGKGKTEINVKTFVRYLLTSNNSNAISIDKEDRRYVIFEFLKIYNQCDIDRLDKIYNSKKQIYLFGEYLMNFKINMKERSDWIKNKPITQAYKLMIFNDSISTFFKDMYNKQDFFEESYISNQYKAMINKDIVKIKPSALYNDYKLFCEDSGCKSFSKNNFNKSIRANYNSFITKKKRGVDYYHISLIELNKALSIEDIYQNNYDNEDETECDSD